jgi:hypothetical protein
VHENWKDTDGTVTGVECRPTRGGDQYSVVFTYKVNGEWYGGTFTSSLEYDKEDTVSVTYDPANPEHNNLVDQEKRRHWLLAALILIPVLVLLFAVLLRR